MENQGFSQRGTSLALSLLREHERNKVAALFLLSLSEKTAHVSANEYRLNRQTCPGIQTDPTSILASAIE